MTNKDILKSKIMQGFSTLIIREFFIKFLAFFGQLILARLLTPNDFGLFVIVVFIVNFFGLFSDIGLSSAIIQKNETLTQKELTNTFFIQTILSSVLILIICIIAPFAKIPYPSLTNNGVHMLQALSFILLFTNIRAVPIAMLERNIRYNLISLIDIIGVVTYYIIAVIAVFMHLGVWSFIIGSLVKEIVETVVVYVVQPFIPQGKLNIASIKHLMKFGLYIQGNGLVSFFATSLNPVINGIMQGPRAVGLVDFASSITAVPESIAVNFGRVAFAGYSRIQQDKALLSRSISKSMSMLAIILFIFPIIIFAFGKELVQIIYTAKWLPSIPALYWFAASTFLYPITAPLAQGILAIGKSKDIFRSLLITTIFGWIVAFLLVNRIGFMSVAVASFLETSILCVWYLYIGKKNELIISSWNSFFFKLIASFLCLLICITVNTFFADTFIFLIFKLIIGLLSYLILFFIFARDDMKKLFSLMYSLLMSKHI